MKIQQLLIPASLAVLALGGCASIEPPSLSDSIAPIQLGFSPPVTKPFGNSAEDVVVNAIRESQKSIHVAAYEFTSETIVDELEKRKTAGVDVRIVADAKEAEKLNSLIPHVEADGIPVRRTSHYSVMHDKFMVIDGTKVETGSFNYTRSAATRNAENAIFIRSMPEIAADYEKEWQRLWDEAGQ